MLTQVLHVNFSSLTVPHLISVVQGDTGRNLKCIVDDFTLDGAWTATWYVERPSDVPVYNTATIETSDNSVNLELTAQSINEVGDNKLQVRILDADEQVVTSFACILSVKPFGGIGAVESSTEANIFDKQVEEAKEEIDTALDEHLENGIFPSMTAGGLVGDSYAENKTPYFFRASGGGAEVGTIESPVLVGGSVGWNQLVADTGSSLSVTVTSGHKYVMKKSGTLSVGSSSGSALTGLTGGADMVTDLTLLLGSTIADRIYTLEQSTAGSGIAQLTAWGFDFGEYIPYSAPTLKHVEGVSAHVMRDANDNIIGNYPLDASLTLRGIPKLDSNNQLYFDGDTYEPDGTVTRRYGIVDLGSLNWTDQSSGTQHSYYSEVISGLKAPGSSSTVAKCVCSAPYNIVDVAGFVTSKGDKALGISTSKRVNVNDNSYATKEAFKTAMSGVYLVYEAVTEEIEQATPYTEYQSVDASGTEEYVSTGVVPVGHDTKYPTDLKGTFETILSAIPSANGTYALKVTVANGKKTFSWV